MLRDLLYKVFPDVTAQQIFCNIQSLKQQIVSAKVRLVILKERNLEEKHRTLARIAALQAEMEQQLFLFLVSTGNDEVPHFRDWIEKLDSTYGPLYSRKFKQWQVREDWRPNLLHPTNQQHLSLYLNCSPLHRIIFPDGAQNQLPNYKLPGGALEPFFNTSLPYNGPAMLPPNILDFKSSIPAQILMLPADFAVPLQISLPPENGSTEHTKTVVSKLMR